jgi:hypothetical protein
MTWREGRKGVKVGRVCTSRKRDCENRGSRYRKEGKEEELKENSSPKSLLSRNSSQGVDQKDFLLHIKDKV